MRTLFIIFISLHIDVIHNIVFHLIKDYFYQTWSNFYWLLISTWVLSPALFLLLHFAFIPCGCWYNRDGEVRHALWYRCHAQSAALSFSARGAGSILLSFLWMLCLKSCSNHQKGNISLEIVTLQVSQLLRIGLDVKIVHLTPKW